MTRSMLRQAPTRTERVPTVPPPGALALRLADGREVPLRAADLVVGSSPLCDLVLDDRTVSACHVRVSYRDGHWVLSDLGSTNGTWAAGVRVAEAALTPGMVLMLGRARVGVVCPGESSPGGTTDAPQMVGQSSAMQRLRTLVEAYAAHPYAVLVRGETGAGKELVARSLHAQSAVSAGPFVAINCAVLKAELAESELFGHERGAFTGADRRRRGVFEEAHGGTLFLDEVAELSPSAQASLLRVLETGVMRRVGGEQELAVRVRVVSATCRDLHGLAEQGRFRQDLTYRLAQFEVTVPPLRTRREDIPALAQRILAGVAAETGRARCLDAGALQRLMAHTWPGNVRELQSILRRAACLGEAALLEAGHLEAAGLPTPVARYDQGVALAGRAPTVLHDRHRPGVTDDLEEPEVPTSGGGSGWPEEVPPGDLEALYRYCDGNLSRLANLTGVARSTLRRRLGHLRPARAG
jgi:DNA-binding NtrC family response regulator